MKKMVSNSLQDTKDIAWSLSVLAKPNIYFLLNGDLGTGKTTFSKMLFEILGVAEIVTSPTFIIMNQYESNDGLSINHVDAYRLNNDSEIDMYIDEFEDSFNVIEWYENLNLDLNSINWVKINIKSLGDGKREFNVEEK